jgi:hypothetical protein
MRRKWWFKVCAVLCLVMLAAFLLPAVASAAEATNALPEGSPMWAQLVYVIVTALVGMLAVPYLARKAQAAKQEAETLRAQGLSSGVHARHLLVVDLKHFLIDYCSTLLEEKLPILLPRILSEKMSSDSIKTILREWGADAKQAAVRYFDAQGLSIVALIGDHYLDQAVRWAADRVSPFPGKETAVQLAQDEYTNWLIDKGVDYVRSQWATGGTPDAPASTPAG